MENTACQCVRFSGITPHVPTLLIVRLDDVNLFWYLKWVINIFLQFGCSIRFALTPWFIWCPIYRNYFNVGASHHHGVPPAHHPLIVTISICHQNPCSVYVVSSGTRRLYIIVYIIFKPEREPETTDDTHITKHCLIKLIILYVIP